MNERRKKFCDNFIKMNDVKKASTATGYIEKTGLRILKDPEAKRYIQSCIKKSDIQKSDIQKSATQKSDAKKSDAKKGDTQKSDVKNKNFATSREVIQCLTDIMRGEEICVDKFIKEKLKAAELLGKIHDIFLPNQNAQEDDRVIIIGSDNIKE